MKSNKLTASLAFILAIIPVFNSEAQDVAPPSNSMFPQWSHDDRFITFMSDRDGDPEIYVMAADGSDTRRLTNSPGRDAHPYFSADNQRIVFQSPRFNGTDTNIYVMNADGSNVVQLTNLIGFAGVPVFSPDDKFIVFQWRESNNFSDNDKWRLCIIRADGSDLQIITSGEANDQVPNWSADGERLLFFSDRTGRNQLFTMDLQGHDVRQLMTSESNDSAAFWSPDNTKLSFASDRDGNSEIYIANSAGTKVRRLTNSQATERAAVWSSDGKRLLITADGDGPSRIYLINVDGTGQISL